MNCMNCAFQSVPIAPLPQTPALKPSPARSLKRNRRNHDGIGGGVQNWVNRLPRGVVGADKVLRLIANATASPISQFVAGPTTFLHSVDPRIKQVWLLVLVVLPARSHIIMRFGLVLYLAFLSVWILPRRTWMDQLGRVSLLSGILFIMLGFGSDGVPPLVQSRTPPPAMHSCLFNIHYFPRCEPLPNNYNTRTTSICFEVVYAPIQLCWCTSCFLLTLLLSLRFINLVFDEVRNVALGIVSRRINWHKLTMMETIDGKIYICSFPTSARIFKNIFTHAEQISQAMIIRGFRGDSNNHKIYFPSTSSNGIADTVSLLCLMGIDVHRRRRGVACWSSRRWIWATRASVGLELGCDHHEGSVTFAVLKPEAPPLLLRCTNMHIVVVLCRSCRRRIHPLVGNTIFAVIEHAIVTAATGDLLRRSLFTIATMNLGCTPVIRDCDTLVYGLQGDGGGFNRAQQWKLGPLPVAGPLLPGRDSLPFPSAPSHTNSLSPRVLARIQELASPDPHLILDLKSSLTPPESIFLGPPNDPPDSNPIPPLRSSPRRRRIEPRLCSRKPPPRDGDGDRRLPTPPPAVRRR
ncbi:hypothetical protein NL676_008034 [Syzygium grande]|nr:hypothetical protein NL676_008034 [Syzygium grande]